MGSFHAKSMKANVEHISALKNFINSAGEKSDVDLLWKTFDKDCSGAIDADELEEIVFHLIYIFWEYSSPNKKIPKRDQLQSIIRHICDNVMRDVDKDNNELIMRKEFDDFGGYIKKQWA